MARFKSLERSNPHRSLQAAAIRPVLGGLQLLALVQEWDVKLGLTLLDSTSICAHQKPAGASRKAELQNNKTIMKRLGGLVAATHGKPMHKARQVVREDK